MTFDVILPTIFIGLLAVFFIIFGIRFRMGKNLSILAGFTTAKFSEKQKSFISKISSDYFFIEAIITLFFLWTFINDQYLMLGIVLLMVPLFMFIIHINLKLRQTK